MQVENNKSLKSLNTFGFDHYAEWYVEANSADDLEAAAEHARAQRLPVFILGGGSNLVITKDLPGLTIRLSNNTVSYSPVKNNAGNDVRKNKICQVTADAGVDWHALVTDTTSKSLTGIENLSLIPGTVGAAPVQNIGAYGVELKDHFSQLRALHLPTGQWREFDRSDCEFAYRNSYFKMHPAEYAIYSVTLQLSTGDDFNLSYQALAAELAKQQEPLTAQLISKTVCAIRRSKLPDPTVVGNAGSFFKNPVISAEQHKALIQQHPDLVAFELPAGEFKVAAGWLIDKLGYKGTNDGDISVYEKQALVLVNQGNGTAKQLMRMAGKIQGDVLSNFQISLEIEPQIV